MTREVVDPRLGPVADLGVKTSAVPSVQGRGWGHGGSAGAGSVSRRN